MFAYADANTYTPTHTHTIHTNDAHLRAFLFNFDHSVDATVYTQNIPMCKKFAL